MPQESRKKALAGANKRGETAAQFMVRAIDTQLAMDAGDRIEMPSDKPEPEPPARPGTTTAELLAHAALMQAAAEAAKVSGVRMPKTAARQFYAILDAAQRPVLGKPPKLPRNQKPVVPAIEGQVAAESPSFSSPLLAGEGSFPPEEGGTKGG
jgi:hypothetical protein